MFVKLMLVFLVNATPEPLPPRSGKFFYSEYKETDNIYYIRLGVYEGNIKQNLLLSA